MGSGGIDSARMEAGAGNWGVGDGFGVRFGAGLHWEPRYPSGSGAIREDFTGGIRSFHSGGVSVQDLFTKPLPCSQNCSTPGVPRFCLPNRGIRAPRLWSRELVIAILRIL